MFAGSVSGGPAAALLDRRSNDTATGEHVGSGPESGHLVSLPDRCVSTLQQEQTHACPLPVPTLYEGQCS